MSIQLLYHQGARAGIPLAVQNTGLLVSGHGINGIDPPLVDLQEQIDDSAREGRHLGGECIHRRGLRGWQHSRNAQGCLALGLGFAVAPHSRVNAEGKCTMPSFMIRPNVALALIVLVWTAIVYQIEIHNVNPCLTLSHLALVDTPAVITGMDQSVHVQRVCIKELAIEIAHTPVYGSNFSACATNVAMYGSITSAV